MASSKLTNYLAAFFLLEGKATMLLAIVEGVLLFSMLPDFYFQSMLAAVPEGLCLFKY